MNVKENHLRYKKLSCVSGIVVLFAAVFIFTLSYVAKEKYWESAHLQDLQIDRNRYADFWDKTDANHKDIQNSVHQCNKEAVPVPDECSDFFQQCNQLIEKYFREVYSVDVSNLLNSLNVMQSTYPDEIADAVGGSYSSELGSLFINTALVEQFMADVPEGSQASVSDDQSFSIKMLRNIYIHETIHYLGFADNPKIGSFMEAITESLTEKVTTFNGIKYENLTGYGEIKEFASQIIDSDPEMIRMTLQDETYKIEEHMEKMIGTNYTELFNDLIFMIQQGGSTRYREVPYLAQYLVYEYIKAVKPDTTQYSELSKSGTVHAFELKWFLHIYG